MKILKCRNKLPINSFGVFLGHPTVGLRLQEAVGRTACDVLQDQNDLFIGLDGLKKLCDIWVIQPFHESDFTSDRLFPLNILDLFLFINLKSHFFVMFFVHGKSYDSIGTLADLLPDYVVIN